MDFNLSKEQELLRDGLGKFLSTDTTSRRAARRPRPGPGWQPDIWRGFADELGILGAALPEDLGGIGGGAVEIMVIAEALGSRAGGGAVCRHRRWSRADCCGGPAARWPRHCWRRWWRAPPSSRWPRRSRRRVSIGRTRRPSPNATATAGCCVGRRSSR